MTPRLPRRSFIHAAGAFALSPAIARSPPRDWPPAEGTGVPKICLGTGANASEKEMRRLRQIGVDHVLTGGPPIPWKEADLRALVERFRRGGLAVANLMIYGFPKAIYGRPGRDEEIDQVNVSIRAAGAAGVPVVEYNFYSHRLTERLLRGARAGRGRDDRLRLRPLEGPSPAA